MPAYVLNRDKVTWRVVDDEAVIVHTDTSDYFSLNESGTWLWTLLEVARTPQDLSAALSARYRRAAAETTPDVDAFVAQLTSAGLLVPGETARAAPTAPTPARGPYEPPQLVKFGNLETLILSGE